MSKSRIQNFEFLEKKPENYDLQYKIILLGNAGVGKTTFIKRCFDNGRFDGIYSPTIGFDFFELNFKLNDLIIRVQIWDTAGQEIYRSIITNFFKNASLALILYSVDDINSYNDINYWVENIKLNSNVNVKLFLIGNKSDLEKERKITKDEAKKFALCNKFDFFEESSAKTGFNARMIIEKAVLMLYNDYNELNEKIIINSSDSKISYSIKTGTYSELSGSTDAPRRKKCCK